MAKYEDRTLLRYTMTFKESAVAKNANENIIRYVPSLSSRKNSIAKHLNKLLQEHPEYINTVYALLTYSTQKWASNMRKEIGFNDHSAKSLEEEAKIVFEQLGDIFALRGIRPLNSTDHLDKLAESDKILECVENATEWIGEIPGIGENMKRTILAAHFMDEEYSDVSAYFINNYYDIAVKYIHEAYGQNIIEHISSIASYNWIEEDSKYTKAYHNTQMLLKIYPTLMHRYQKHSDIEMFSDGLIQRDANGLNLVLSLTKGVEAIKYYKDNGEELYTILKLMMKETPEYKIEREISCKTSALRLRKAKAINLLSFVLWGYSTSQILQGCVYRK